MVKCLQRVLPTKSAKKNFEIFAFFSEYFFQNELKKTIPLVTKSNLKISSQTSKYHLDVSQLSDRCFTGFLLSLLTVQIDYVRMAS
jgi:hypothetical protein